MTDEQVIHVDTSVSSVTITTPDGQQTTLYPSDGTRTPVAINRPIPWKIP